MKTYTPFIMISVLIAVLLGACGDHVEELKIDNVGFAESLFVQKVEDFTSTEALTKTITEPAKIEKTFQRLEGIEMREISGEKVTEMMKSNDTYMFSLSKTDKMTTGKVPYGFTILGDGTIIFTHSSVGKIREKPLISTKLHKDIFDSMKEELDIIF